MRIPDPCDLRDLRARVVLSAMLSLWWPTATPAQADVYIYPAGCFDAYGRPLNADPADPSRSRDASCQPPSGGVVMRGSRGGAAPSPGSPSMQPGSINLPPTPVPVPGGLGVMNP
jgi:hypothetical protein